MLGRIRMLALVISVCLLAMSASPALAAPPDNDDLADATVVTALPYSNSQDTSDATTQPTDPDDCGIGAGPTVWYAFTPAASGRLEVNTFGSDYDTTLYLGTPDGSGGVDVLACNDDAGGDLQSRIRFDADEGVAYLVMVGAFAGGPGGSLTFNLLVAPPVEPLVLSLSLDPTGRFERNGDAIVSGTVTCSGADSVWLYGSLAQQVGRFRVLGDGDTSAPCSAGGVSWQIRISGDTGSFAGGRAAAWVGAEACDDDVAARYRDHVPE